MTQEDPAILHDVEAEPEKSESYSSKDLDNKSDDKKSEDDVKISLGIQLIFFLIGTNILFSYNTFLSGTDFYGSLVGHQRYTYGGKVNIGRDLPRVLIITSETVNLCSLPFIESFRLISRLYFSMTIMAIVQIVIYFYVNFGDPQYYIIYLLAALTSAAQSVIFGSSMGFAGLFGDKTSALANTGVALGGLITSLLWILAKGVFPNSVRNQGFLYLFFSCFVSIATAVTFHFFSRTEIAQKRLKLAQTSNDFFFRLKRIKGVFLKIWPFVIEGWLHLTITLTFYPGYMFLAGNQHFKDFGWFTTVMILCYNIGDFLGRFVTRFFLWPKPKYLWIPHALRLLFIPLIVVSVEVPKLRSDVYMCIMSFLLAVTTGYFGGLCIVYTATSEKLATEEIDLGVFTTVLATNLGVFTGVWLTFLSNNLHEKYSPQ
ncbi:Nucleoside transporter family protein [Trichomonas vaginalis G3]|uniref:Nucleoside transporter family protein n=1 Tax=Trichomonas vaginalis (strain ATCC PRA-98 / G3) TaxID=412133 RepID=A2E5Q4_TRIV3|nr:nucleoside transmembrane transporter protein [Trichomonas vaginalis G3]EAY11974.1 Nucleoside transporter family protein [Trichomonas vaginalis G3]KAI5524861.1 nucleoside transmembrane transporter protein [Trichomonas vaginalis G3]|eukprot:XP_001324197.1 Nucleoside transporter family protein [Trichomonas vaginalis G3]